MSTAVRAFRLRELLFALALAGALSGLVGMHHVLAAGDDTSALMLPVAVQHDVAADAAHTPPAQPAPHDGQGGGHSASDLLHLCLAVLAGALVVVIALILLHRHRRRPDAGPGRAADTSTGSRGPPLPVPRRLALLCVLRT